MKAFAFIFIFDDFIKELKKIITEDNAIENVALNLIHNFYETVSDFPS